MTIRLTTILVRIGSEIAELTLIFLQYCPAACKVDENLYSAKIGEVAEWLKATVC
jgi:hypothetical protein